MMRQRKAVGSWEIFDRGRLTSIIHQMCLCCRRFAAYPSFTVCQNKHVFSAGNNPQKMKWFATIHIAFSHCQFLLRTKGFFSFIKIYFKNCRTFLSNISLCQNRGRAYLLQGSGTPGLWQSWSRTAGARARIDLNGNVWAALSGSEWGLLEQRERVNEWMRLAFITDVGELAGIRMGQEPSFTPADGSIECGHGDHSEVAGLRDNAAMLQHFNAVSVWLKGSFREKSGMSGRLRSLENWCSQEGISKTANQREGEALSSRGSSCWGEISVLRRFFLQDTEQIW